MFVQVPFISCSNGLVLGGQAIPSLILHTLHMECLTHAPFSIAYSIWRMSLIHHGHDSFSIHSIFVAKSGVVNECHGVWCVT